MISYIVIFCSWEMCLIHEICCGESVVAAILPSRMVVSYCTFRFFFVAKLAE